MRRRAVSMLCGALACIAIAAVAAEADTAERDRIREERAVAEAKFLERERECQTRFVVTSCVDAAKRDRRDALAALQAQQRVLDEADRRRNAAQQLEAIEKKASGEDARPVDAAGGHAGQQKLPPPQVKVRSPDGGASAPRDVGFGSISGTASKSAVDRRADEARSVSSFEANQQAAREHREAVARRNAERAEKAPPHAPLPVPPAASAP